MPWVTVLYKRLSDIMFGYFIWNIKYGPKELLSHMPTFTLSHSKDESTAFPT